STRPLGNAPITSDCFSTGLKLHRLIPQLFVQNVDGLSFNELPGQEQHQHNMTIVLMAISPFYYPL
ncbi:hypothetical protein M5D96_004434, partial [Drosophila gunungcola]